MVRIGATEHTPSISTTVQHQVTDIAEGTTVTMPSGCPLTCTSTVTTATHDVGTGVISEGGCAWNGTGNLHNFSLTLSEATPSPEVDLQNPR